MKIKLFGKELFEFRAKSHDFPTMPAMESLENSKFIPDFYKDHGSSGDWGDSAISNYAIMETTSGGLVAVPKSQQEQQKKVEKKKLSPKEVFELKTLNDKGFKLAVDPAYVDAQIANFKEKLTLIKGEEYDMRRGVEQIASILLRMENRKKYSTFNHLFEPFPYTTNTKIAAMLKEHDNLQIGQIAQFLADMPKEATDAMKQYNDACKKLCDKQAVFYIIADKKDFKKTNSRRDPILVAQSPFGHVWQILGAWDKEMLFLDEL